MSETIMSTITYKVLIEIEDNTDFCESDLHEAIVDGLQNVGNYESKKVEVEELGECDTCGSLTPYYTLGKKNRIYYCDNCEN